MLYQSWFGMFAVEVLLTLSICAMALWIILLTYKLKEAVRKEGGRLPWELLTRGRQQQKEKSQLR